MFAIFAALVSFAAVAAAATYPKVTVELYYEALCPGCQAFITGALKKHMDVANLAAITDLKLVPYGNTQIKNGIYTCQHGADECASDVLQQCVLYKLSGNISAITDGTTSEDAYPFVYCVTNAGGGSANAQGCFQSSFPTRDYAEIQACAENEADETQKAAADATPTHDYTPWVLVGGELLGNTNLLTYTVCKDYTGPKPAECKGAATTKQSVTICPK